MRRFAGMCLTMLALASQARAEDAPVLVEDPTAMLSDQIARNWNVDIGALEQCPEEISLRVYLESDGTVSKVDQLADLSIDACRQVSESARRAVYITRKLDFAGRTVPPTMILMFHRPQ